MQPFSPDLLSGRTALITGGGTGIGLSLAKRFATLGAGVIICGRRQRVLDAAVEEIRAAGGHDRAWAFPCDIRDPQAVAEMIERSWRASVPDILVNNAAASFIAQSQTLSSRAVDAVLGVTLHGALYCTLEVGRRWIEDGRPGVILSILSTSTLTGRAFTTPSAMAKAGLLAMTRSLAVEWGPKGVRLVAIAPGAFPTQGSQAQLNPAARRGRGSSDLVGSPLGRAGSQVELANLASYLVSDAAGYMTGEMVVLDGGQHLRASGVEDLLGWTDQDWEAHRAARSRPSGDPDRRDAQQEINGNP